MTRRAFIRSLFRSSAWLPFGSLIASGVADANTGTHTSTSASTDPPAAELRETRPLMGTRVEVVARLRSSDGPDSLRPRVDAAFAGMQRLSDLMNHYDPASQVSEINRRAGGDWVSVDPALLEVLQQAAAVSRISDGAFDITIGGLRGWRFGTGVQRVPDEADISAQLPLIDYRNLEIDTDRQRVRLAKQGMRIDLGGIAKLYILDAGVRMMCAAGIDELMLNGGGDVLVGGADPRHAWRIGVRDPREPARLLGVVTIREGIVASSGDYERQFVREGRRYHHILDPRTGMPSRGLHGVSLVAKDYRKVNGLGAAMMVLGPERARALAKTAEVDAMTADEEGHVWMTPGFESLLDTSSTTNQ